MIVFPKFASLLEILKIVVIYGSKRNTRNVSGT